MRTGRHNPGSRAALLKAGLAGLGVAFFIVALTASNAPWAYGAGATLLAASVCVRRRPRTPTRRRDELPPDQDGPSTPDRR